MRGSLAVPVGGVGEPPTPARCKGAHRSKLAISRACLPLRSAPPDSH